MWGANLRGGAEVGEFGWGVAESLLRPVGESCQEVPEEGSLFRPCVFFYQMPGCVEMENDVGIANRLKM